MGKILQFVVNGTLFDHLADPFFSFLAKLFLCTRFGDVDVLCEILTVHSHCGTLYFYNSYNKVSY